MKRLRCCGRWCYWRVPFGPWACTSCERTFWGDVPKCARARFWDAIHELVARLPPPVDLGEARRILGEDGHAIKLVDIVGNE